MSIFSSFFSFQVSENLLNDYQQKIYENKLCLKYSVVSRFLAWNYEGDESKTFSFFDQLKKVDIVRSEAFYRISKDVYQHEEFQDFYKKYQAPFQSLDVDISIYTYVHLKIILNVLKTKILDSVRDEFIKTFDACHQLDMVHFELFQNELFSFFEDDNQYFLHEFIFKYQSYLTLPKMSYVQMEKFNFFTDQSFSLQNFFSHLKDLKIQFCLSKKIRNVVEGFFSKVLFLHDISIIQMQDSKGDYVFVKDVINLSDVVKKIERSVCKTVSIFSLSKVILDQDISLHGVNLEIIAPSIDVSYPIRVDLSGKDQQNFPDGKIKARNGRFPSDHGAMGLTGLNGQNGGSFFLFAKTFSNISNLTVISNGGKGGKGQDGGDGMNGMDAKEPKDLSSFFASILDDSCSDKYYLLKGEAATNGGNGGSGGQGGLGGALGRVLIYKFEDDGSYIDISRSISVVNSSGQRGECGRAGKPGLGGMDTKRFFYKKNDRKIEEVANPYDKKFELSKRVSSGIYPSLTINQAPHVLYPKNIDIAAVLKKYHCSLDRLNTQFLEKNFNVYHEKTIAFQLAHVEVIGDDVCKVL